MSIDLCIRSIPIIKFSFAFAGENNAFENARPGGYSSISVACPVVMDTGESSLSHYWKDYRRQKIVSKI